MRIFLSKFSYVQYLVLIKYLQFCLFLIFFNWILVQTVWYFLFFIDYLPPRLFCQDLQPVIYSHVWSDVLLLYINLPQVLLIYSSRTSDQTWEYITGCRSWQNNSWGKLIYSSRTSDQTWDYITGCRSWQNNTQLLFCQDLQPVIYSHVWSDVLLLYINLPQLLFCQDLQPVIYSHV
jgi:hypothetical protein